MKTKLAMIGLLLLSLLLTGCACEHQWTQSDCLNPQVCENCEETGAPPLGHDWQPATCTVPETCSRCGATEGDAPGHSFDDWLFEDEQMTHTCTLCSCATISVAT